MSLQNKLNIAFAFRLALTSLLFILSVGELFDGVLDAGDFVAPMLLALFINDVQARHFGKLESDNSGVELETIKKSKIDVFLRVVIVLLMIGGIFSEVIAPVTVNSSNSLVAHQVLRICAFIWGGLLLFVSMKDLKDSFHFMKVIYCHIAVGVMALAFYI